VRFVVEVYTRWEHVDKVSRPHVIEAISPITVAISNPCFFWTKSFTAKSFSLNCFVFNDFAVHDFVIFPEHKQKAGIDLANISPKFNA